MKNDPGEIHAGLYGVLAQTTQPEFKTARQRLEGINQRLTESAARTGREAGSRCVVVNFSVDSKHVTDARNLISKVCGDKLIYIRVKPVLHASVMEFELFVDATVAQRIKDMLKASFASCRGFRR